MTPKSPNSIRKSIVTNPAIPLRQRLKALREMNPSIRFLNRLLKDPSLPEKLRAKELGVLAERTAASLAPRVAKPQEKPGQESDSEPIVIPYAMWEFLAPFNDPRYVRGPAPEKCEP